MMVTIRAKRPTTQCGDASNVLFAGIRGCVVVTVGSNGLTGGSNNAERPTTHVPNGNSTGEHGFRIVFYLESEGLEQETQI